MTAITMLCTHGTPAFIADLAADIYQLHTQNYREGIRMETDKFTNDQVTPGIIKKRRGGKDVTDTLAVLYSMQEKSCARRVRSKYTYNH